MKPITICEAVEELRSQISEAQKARPDDGLVFEIVEAELQIRGTLSRSVEAGGSGGVTFSVLGIGAEAGASAGTVSGQEVAHTVTLKLSVRGPSGPVEIARETGGRF